MQSTSDPFLVARRDALAAVAGLLLPTVAAAQEPSPRTPPPAYTPLRQNEDWSKFRASDADDPTDRLKHLELDDRGSIWLSIGGRADARFEAWNGIGFGATNPGNSDTFTLSRLTLHTDLHLGEHVRVFVEPRTAQSTDRDLPGGRRTLDMDTFDLFQGFVDLSLSLGDTDSVRLRVGRQSFLFGNQRLVSPLLWVNVWNAWEGASLGLRVAGWSIEAFHTEFVQVDRTDWNEADDGRTLYGAYATRPAAKDGRGLDLYLLGDTREAVTVNGSTGDERRHTLGARSFGALGHGFDGELEGAWQFGEVGTSSVSAWFVSSVLGHRFAEASLTPRVFVGLDAASGDDRAGGSVGTFHQLYPLGHAYLGYADAFGRQNLAAAQLGVQLTLTEATTFAATAHAFRLMDRGDALYAVNGTVARTGLASHDVGQEIDLLLTHRFDRHLDAYLGYSHLFTGSGLNGTGPTDDQDFAYVGAGLVF